MTKKITRELVANALKAANVVCIRNNALIELFINGDADIAMADLSLDSLATMEFCIYCEINHDVSIIPDSVHEYETLSQLAHAIEERMQ